MALACGLSYRFRDVQMLFSNNSNNLFKDALLAVRFLSTLCMLGIVMVAGYSQSAAQVKHSDDLEKTASDAAPEDGYFKTIYRSFYDTYRLGPGDEVAIRVLGQPDYSFQKMKVSPVGRIYHPLVGDIEVVGFTVPQLEKKLTADFSEYVINPKVSVSLEEAQSAKIGVLGEVKAPSIVIIARPMTILEAINTTGGFTETANRSDVILLRPDNNGIMQKRNINVKKILDGKAGPEENVMVRAGDTVIVNGNFQKKMTKITSSLGFAQFLSFLVLGRV